MCVLKENQRYYQGQKRKKNSKQNYWQRQKKKKLTPEER